MHVFKLTAGCQEEGRVEIRVRHFDKKACSMGAAPSVVLSQNLRGRRGSQMAVLARTADRNEA